jgi:hypothetical protein
LARYFRNVQGRALGYSFYPALVNTKNQSRLKLFCKKQFLTSITSFNLEEGYYCVHRKFHEKGRKRKMTENSSKELQSKSSDIWPTEKERRSHERYSPPAVVELKGEAFNFVLQDISIGGFAFLTNEKFSNRQTLLVSLGKLKQVQAEVIHQRNVVFDPVFIKNRYAIHCRFMTPILESDINNLFKNIAGFNITFL